MLWIYYNVNESDRFFLSSIRKFISKNWIYLKGDEVWNGIKETDLPEWQIQYEKEKKEKHIVKTSI